MENVDVLTEIRLYRCRFVDSSMCVRRVIVTNRKIDAVIINFIIIFHWKTFSVCFCHTFSSFIFLKKLPFKGKTLNINLSTVLPQHNHSRVSIREFPASKFSFPLTSGKKNYYSFDVKYGYWPLKLYESLKTTQYALFPQLLRVIDMVNCHY